MGAAIHCGCHEHTLSLANKVTQQSGREPRTLRRVQKRSDAAPTSHGIHSLFVESWNSGWRVLILRILRILRDVGLPGHYKILAIPKLAIIPWAAFLRSDTKTAEQVCETFFRNRFLVYPHGPVGFGQIAESADNVSGAQLICVSFVENFPTISEQAHFVRLLLKFQNWLAGLAKVRSPRQLGELSHPNPHSTSRRSQRGFPNCRMPGH